MNKKFESLLQQIFEAEELKNDPRVLIEMGASGNIHDPLDFPLFGLLNDFSHDTLINRPYDLAMRVINKVNRIFKQIE